MSRLAGLLWLLLFLSTLRSAALAQGDIVERIPVTHLKPSLILNRIDVLAGLPTGARAVDIRADDPTATIVVRIPHDYKDQLERDRVLAILRDFVAHLDRPEPELTVDIYVVQTNLLSDEEFKILDDKLKKEPLDMERGVTAKGVVYFKQVLAQNQEVFAIDDQMREARGVTRADPVRLTGRMLPALRGKDDVFLSADLRIAGSEQPLANGKKEVIVRGTGETTSGKPMVIFAGELKRLSEPKLDTFPARHEVMIYIWARPEA